MGIEAAAAGLVVLSPESCGAATDTTHVVTNILQCSKRSAAIKNT